MALFYVAKSLESEDIDTRLRNESLSMGAILAYQFNAIIYRPAEGRAEKVLLEAACQHIVDESTCSYPILYNRGCYFLSDAVKADKSYHLPTVRRIDCAVLASLYRRDSFQDIEAEFCQSQTRKRKKTHFAIDRPLKIQRIMKNTNDRIWSVDNLDVTDMSDTGWESTVEELEEAIEQSGEIFVT